MSLLDLRQKTFLIFGLANRKSIAWFTGKLLESSGANVLYSVRSEKRREELSRWIDPKRLWVCDVEDEGAIQRLRQEIENECVCLDGILHALAFANFSEGFKPFYETCRADFLQAAQIFLS